MLVTLKKSIAILMLLIASFSLFAEEGEMLRFNNQVNLNFAIESATAGSSSEDVLYISEASSLTEHTFDRVLFNGKIFSSDMQSEKQALLLQISLKRNGVWTNWQDAPLEIFANGRFWARADMNRSARQLRYRLVARAATNINKLHIYAVEALDSRNIAERNRRVQEEQAEPFSFVKTDTVEKPTVVDRQQWGANPPIGAYVPHSPFRLTQHHTAGGRVATLADGIQEMQFIQSFHQNGRGWQDIGYHFCVDDSGRIYEGVPSQYRGTHVGNNNTGNVGISYMGNLEISGELPTPKAIESLKKMWSWLSFNYGVNPDSLFGHRDYNATSCPGSNLYIRLPELRDGVRETLGFGTPYVSNPRPQPFSTEVSANSEVRFNIKDTIEGVDVNTIILRVNGATVTPTISGSPSDYQVSYTPPQPFPASQNVRVEIEALDLGASADTMRYEYLFTIQIAALYVEAQSSTQLRNGTMTVEGNWTVDAGDVDLTDLQNGVRLIAQDTDGSHRIKVFPAVIEPGDYNIYIASESNYIGESARYRIVDENGRETTVFPEYNSRYFRQWGLLSATPVYFDDDGDANGYIELAGLNGLPTRLVLDAFRLVKVDRLDSPTIPTLKLVQLTDEVNRTITVNWYPNTEGDIAGYRLYASEDGRSWTTPIADETQITGDMSSYDYTFAENTPVVYFRMVAVDTNKVENPNGGIDPLLSPFSDIYGVGITRITNILVVDNFDRQASWSSKQHPFVRSHGEALVPNNHGFDAASETAVQNGDINLSEYEIVMYICGDDSRTDESLAAADQFRLLDYVRGGGKLFISGSEIGYDIDASPSAEQARYATLLKASYQGDLSGSNRVIGQTSSEFEGLDFRYGEVSANDNYIEDYPDYLQAAGGGESILFYGNLRVAGVRFTGIYPNGTDVAQMLYLGFPFETTNLGADRTALMQRILTYFGQPTAIGDDLASLPETFSLEQNYPNPFNPETTLRFAVPADANGKTVKLEIFNSLGQKVRTLVNQQLKPGAYQSVWDGRNGFGNQVASGIYLYRLSSGSFSTSRKMILMK
ncbi:MAG: N-acetylmuramoyl-L-alanine amidase [Calditrichia bacterium]